MELRQYRHILNSSEWKNDPSQLPPLQATWLLHQGSLTEKLQKKTANLQVQVITEEWHQTYWLREVLLKNADQPWIFARTIVPDTSWQCFSEQLQKLGNQPIGLWLFSQQPQRLNLEWRQDPTSKLYARRSTWQLQKQILHIQELFLAQFDFY